MHLPDGFISVELSLPAYGVVAPLWVLAAKRHLGRDRVEAIPVIGALTALAFVVQTIMIPVPGGTSTHVVGLMLLALLYGPLMAFLSESLVLLLQAVFFGAGGITVLSINALALGLIGPLAGWITWRALRPMSERVAMFAAGWMSMQAATLAIVGVLAFQHHLDPNYYPVPGAITLTAMMVPSLTLAGVLEGLFTVFALSLVKKARLRGVDD